MDQQTSFIPKKSLAKDPVTRESPVGLFMLIATLLFFLSLFAGAGAFFYTLLLKNDIKVMTAALEKAERAFEPSLIIELERLDRRIEASKEILANHVVVSPLFRLLETTTIPNVRFNKFNYAFASADKIELTMGGQARSYAYVAVQSDVIGKSKYVAEHLFSNLNLDSLGNVTFELFARLNPSLVSYKDVIARDGLSASIVQ